MVKRALSRALEVLSSVLTASIHEPRLGSNFVRKLASDIKYRKLVAWAGDIFSDKSLACSRLRLFPYHN